MASTQAYSSQHFPPTNTTTTSIAPTPRTTAALNLAVLQRHNASITQILSIAPFAAVYVFNPLGESSGAIVGSSLPGAGPEAGIGGAWEKTGVEGTLFVVRLRGEVFPGYAGAGLSENEAQRQTERYAVLILNRRGLDNFMLQLRRAEDVEIAEPFVMLTLSDEHKTSVFGIWIFSSSSGATTAAGSADESDVRGITARVMVECAERAEQSAWEWEEAQAQLRGGIGQAAAPAGQGRDGQGQRDRLLRLFGGGLG